MLHSCASLHTTTACVAPLPALMPATASLHFRRLARHTGIAARKMSAHV